MQFLRLYGWLGLMVWGVILFYASLISGSACVGVVVWPCWARHTHPFLTPAPRWVTEPETRQLSALAQALSIPPFWVSDPTNDMMNSRHEFTIMFLSCCLYWSNSMASVSLSPSFTESFGGKDRIDSVWEVKDDSNLLHMVSDRRAL